MKMPKSYKAVFLIPAGAAKTLDETGWSFVTPDRLSPKIVDLVVQTLCLNFKESYLDIDAYVGPGIKMSAIKDDNGQVEQIYFQLTTKEVGELREALSCVELPNVELFVP